MDLTKATPVDTDAGAAVTGLGAGPAAGRVATRMAAALEGSGPALAFGFAEPVPVPWGTVAVIQTSGSTGVPKAVLISRAALLASVQMTAVRLGQGRWVLALPAGYIAGLQVLARSIMAGSAPAAIAPGHSAAEFVAAAQTDPAPRFVSLVPAQLARLVAAAEQDASVRAALQGFDAILVGGQASAPALLAAATELGARVVRTYGATETCGGCVYDGVPLSGVRLRASVGDHGGVAGEILIAGAMLAEGYLGEPERTATAFITDATGTRWYRSGDLGTVTGGILTITGRVDNVIISGGVNISLDRVEQVVRTVPGLGNALVIGTDDVTWGEASVIVVPAEGAGDADAALQEARAAVTTHLGRPAAPARVMLIDEVPTLPSGKPDRARLRRWVAGG